jgi:hypothetical protein
VIRQYDPLLIPGLLQTEEYGRAILQHTYGVGPDDVGRLWSVRQHRQELHDRDDPPDMLFVIDEATVARQVGRSGKTMLRQLERLREYADETHVTLQVLLFTAGEHPGMAGPFALLEFADADLDDLVHLESVDQATIKDDSEQIARYLDRYQRMEELALSPEESRRFLDDYLGRQRIAGGPAAAATVGG